MASRAGPGLHAVQTQARTRVERIVAGGAEKGQRFGRCPRHDDARFSGGQLDQAGDVAGHHLLPDGARQQSWSKQRPPQRDELRLRTYDVAAVVMLIIVLRLRMHELADS